MNVAMQLKVPIDSATQMLDRLRDLRAAHTQQVKELQKKIKTQPSQRLDDEATALAERGRRLSPNNFMRVVISAGMDVIAKAKDDELLSKLAEDDVVRGRPRGR